MNEITKYCIISVIGTHAGESINKIPIGIRKKYNEIVLEKFLKARNIISHAYFAVNPRIIWSIVKKDLPELKKQINKILKNESAWKQNFRVNEESKKI